MRCPKCEFENNPGARFCNACGFALAEERSVPASAESPKEDPAYEYYAFISYNHRDEKWAKWLQQTLEKYHLPATLCKEDRTLPRSIRPIFRDATDLSVGHLTKMLYRELDSSKRLIVICSPQSAKSTWVNAEVQHFIDMGRYDDIIPFIVEGKPDGGEAECFPAALRAASTEQLLGVSVEELGKQDAFLRVVSGLLNIKYDRLRQRHKQQMKRKRLIRATVASVIALVFGTGGYLAWDYYTPHETYYADYVLRYGAPEGIGPLTKEEIALRASHYVLVSERRKIVSLVHANSSGMPRLHDYPEYLERPMIAHYTYSDDGRIRTVEHLDNNGRVVLAMHYTSDLKAADLQFSQDDSSFVTTAASSTGMAREDGVDHWYDTKSDITRYVYEYDEKGYIIKTVYMRDNRGTAVLDADGIGGLSYTLDEYGRPTEIQYLGFNGNEKVATSLNITGKRYTYDNHFNLFRVEYLNPEGEHEFNVQGWMIEENTYDANANRVEAVYLYDGKPVVNWPSMDYAYLAFEYDGCGNAVKKSYFNQDRELGRTDWHKGDQYGVDDLSSMTYEELFESQQEATDWSPETNLRITDGSAYETMEYDERGNITKISYYDVNGQPVLTNIDNNSVDGMEEYCFATKELEYDERGNRTKESYFGLDGRPVVIIDGYASMEWEWDERGNKIRESFFGADGQPIANYGYASIITAFDEHNREVSLSYLGVDGQLVNTEMGYAIHEREWDERGNEVRQLFKDAQGQLVLNNRGFAILAWEYDERGNRVKEQHRDTSGQLVVEDSGYAYLIWEYDEHGRLIKQAYFDEHDRPYVGANGSSYTVIEYDEHGQGVWSAYDAEGQLISGGDRNEAVSIAMTQDEQGNIIRMAYLDENGQPVMGPGGYAYIEYDYNGDDYKIKEAYYDTDGQLVLGYGVYAYVEYEYNEDGQIIKEAYYDTDGQLDIGDGGYAYVEYEYDDEGRMIKELFYDATGGLIDGN